MHVRPVAGLLGRMMAEDGRPLTVAREPAGRLPGNCRHFTVLAAAMLRAQGTPARARCGFGGYFGSGAFEDHWVCEYWDQAAPGWKLADAQIDDVQLKLFDVDFDLMDVPRDKFLVAGDAWRLCRAGDADPAKFGLSFMNEGGYWWIAANLLRDVAALNNMEMLPWDVWGAMPAPDETIDDERLALLRPAGRAHPRPRRRVRRPDRSLRATDARASASVCHRLQRRPANRGTGTGPGTDRGAAARSAGRDEGGDAENLAGRGHPAGRASRAGVHPGADHRGRDGVGIHRAVRGVGAVPVPAGCRPGRSGARRCPPSCSARASAGSATSSGS